MAKYRFQVNDGSSRGWFTDTIEAKNREEAMMWMERKHGEYSGIYDV